MCEFCTKHGEGKIWYLQMKNYSEELMNAPLSAEQRQVVTQATRAEWLRAFFEGFVLPATGRMPAAGGQPTEEESGEGREPPTREEYIRYAKLTHFGQVLPIEDVYEVFDLATSITRMPCGCRYFNTGKTDQRYCFGVGVDAWGVMGQYPQASASLEVLTRQQAKAFCRQFDEEGLMHSVWTGMTPYTVGVCNCDHDCGAYLWSYEKRGYPNFFRAEYVAEVDWDACQGCRSCMSQCQFGAIFYSSAQKRVYIEPDRCYGCGVCRAVCPQDAISLLNRRDVPAAAEVWL